ncbi:hypothetical protein RB653_000914 [Dictyostelium firmibasis]|uniref:Transmembrane protein n=1 Tax=Dictyostelium firmibasis TaxID=79012 RepID=A0AAN7U7J7_9MYCE
MFLNLVVNCQRTTVDIYVSTYGNDDVECGSLNSPCKTIEGSFSSFQSIIENMSPYYYQLNLYFYSGTYYSTSPQELFSYYVSFYTISEQTTYSSGDFVYFANNATTPMFKVTNSGSYVMPTVVIFNDIIISNPYYSSTHLNEAYFMYIDPNQNVNTINVQFNGVSIPFGPISEIVYVYNQNYNTNPMGDWESYSQNLIVPYVTIGFSDSEFGNDIYTSSFDYSLVYSPYFPISLTIDNCNFTKIIASQTLFPIGRSQISFSNIQMEEVFVSYKPFFVIQNSQVTIRDSSFAGTIDHCAFLVCLGCFFDFRNNNNQFYYQSYSWNQDYPVLDIEKSFATIANSSIALTGQQQQQNDQGVIYAINSDVSIRMSAFSSNISFLINSDGSNFYGYLVGLSIYNSVYQYYVCSTKHRSVFKGDGFFRSNVPYGKNCEYYDDYQDTISALDFVFVGVAFVLLCSFLIYSLRICCLKRKSKRILDTHTYTPICSGDISPISSINPNI